MFESTAPAFHKLNQAELKPSNTQLGSARLQPSWKAIIKPEKPSLISKSSHPRDKQ